ncbi:DUF1572 family protein [Bacillus paramycoides]|uniref:DUF1572 family protein n=1 Tax=Bacillus paramycoides TaxID=2026194 RepID=UPI0040587562
MLTNIVKENLIEKFIEIQNRMISAINQLDDDDLNWRPNFESNSIANLVIHISGNIHQRIEVGIEGKVDNRDREAEFSPNLVYNKEELIQIIQASFSKLIDVISHLAPDDYLKPQKVRNNQVTILDVVMQCASHFSEHLGQILYIAKIKKNVTYISTSIPRKNHSN